MDTGNNSQSVIDEQVFKAIHPGGDLEPSDLPLTGPSEGHILTVLGRSKDILELEFYNPENKNSLKYHVRPVVVKNLHVPFILSRRDLKALRAVVDCDTDEVLFKTNSGPFTIKLTHLPGHSFDLPVDSDLTVPPNSEMVAKIQIDPKRAKNYKNKHVVFQPNVDLDNVLGLICPASISTIKKSNPNVYIRFCNFNSHPVTLKKGRILGDLEILGHEGFTWSNTIGLIDSDKEIETKIIKRSELYKRLWEDLDFSNDKCALSYKEKQEIIRLLAFHRDALALNPEDVGSVKNFQVHIDTGDTEPIRMKTRPLPPFLLEALRKQLRKWLDQRVIEPADGPWGFPIVPVKKKGPHADSYRFAVDYRLLNLASRKTARPVANMQTKLSLLRSDPQKPYTYFCCLDISEAYHALEIAPDSQDKTAIVTPDGLFRFKKLPFGLASAPMEFQSLVQLIEQGLADKNVDLARSILMYFDDVIIGAHSFDDLVAKLDLFVSEIKALGLRLAPKKCKIGFKELKWLGHTINAQGISPDFDRVSVLENWPPPVNLTQARGIFGLANYFKRFIRHFSAKTHHIRQCLKSKKIELEGFHWTPSCEREFQNLLNELKGPNILGHPDFSENSSPFILSVDSSSLGIGSILSQEQNVLNPVTNKIETREVLIAYGSRALKDGESSLSSFCLELSGLVTSIHHFKYYLLGRAFKVRTDHRGLSWIMTTQNPNLPSKVFRWQQALADYDFTIEYVSAAKMSGPDSLSRKGYKEGDAGNMECIDAPMNKREPLWHSDFDSEQARIRTDDEFWLAVVQKRFRDSNDRILPSTQTVNVITRAQRAKIAQESNEFPEGEVASQMSNFEVGSVAPMSPQPPAHRVSTFDARNVAPMNLPPPAHQVSNFEAGTVAPMFPTPSEHGAKSLPANQVFSEPLAPSNKDTNDNLQDISLNVPNFPDETLYNEIELYNEIKKGFESDSTESQNFRDLYKKESEKITNFQRYLLKLQSEDICFIHIKECLNGNFKWPKDFEEIRQRLLQLFHVLKIGKDCEKTDLQKQQLMLVYLFRQQAHIFLNNHDILMIKKEVDNEIKTLFLIPFALRTIMINLFHSSSGTMHLGRYKTKHLCHNYFDFYNMNSEIDEFIDTCKLCIDGKKLTHKFNPGLGSTTTNPSDRLKRFAMDIMEFPVGTWGMKYLLTLMDIATSWLECYPLRKADSKSIITKLESEFLPRYNAGLIFIVDAGTEFGSKMMQKHISSNGCILYVSTSAWPNSLAVERCHRSIVSLIRIILIKNNWSKEKWVLCLPEVLRTIRHSPDSATLKSAYERCFGKRSTNKIDLVINPLVPIETDSLKPLDPYPDIDIENNFSISENNDKITVTNNKDKSTRSLIKMDKYFIQNVNNINEIIPDAEIYQLEKDLKTNQVRDRNKRNYEKGKVLFRPIKNELVDYLRPLDPDSKSSRKLAMYFHGPYLIKQVNDNLKTAIIVELNDKTLDPISKPKQVHIAYLRPSLVYSFKYRANLANQIPWENFENIA